MRDTLMAGAARFAHFAGLGAKRVRAADDEDDKPQGRRAAEDDEDEDKPKGRRASDEDEDDKPKGRKARASEDDEDDDKPQGRKARASEDQEEDDDKPKGRRASEGDEDDDKPHGRKARASEDDEDEDDKPKGRRARASDDDEDEDDDHSEMSGKSTAAKARRRERARCAAIFSSPKAAANLELACSLAFETDLTRRQALAVLNKSPSRADNSSSERRRANNPNLEPGGQDAPQATTQASWARAFGSAGANVSDKPLLRG
jgi:hypothetical protein